jgi:hypothetical protein
VEDEERKDGPLIDLSHRVEGKGSLLMLLIEALAALLKKDDDPAVREKLTEERREAMSAFLPALPHVYALIRASYDITIQGPDGKDALALLVGRAIPVDTVVWAYHLTEALLDRGADFNTRFLGGRTPLIYWASGCTPPKHPDCTPGPILLLRRGADIDARSDDGSTCAHNMASKSNRPLAAALANGGWLAAADLTQRDDRGETALQVAQRMLAADPSDADKAIICDLLRDHAALWVTHARPLMHQWLSHSLLIPDLAHVVLSFVDGKERG